MSSDLCSGHLHALSMVMTEYNVELGSLSCEYSEHEELYLTTRCFHTLQLQTVAPPSYRARIM